MILDRIDPLVPRSLYFPYQEVKVAYSLRQAWRQVHEKTPFDVIQVANVLAVGLFFGRSCQVPVVTRMSSFRPANVRAAGGKRSLVERVRGILERQAVTGSTSVYAPSHLVARQVSQAYGISQVDVLEPPFYLSDQNWDRTLADVENARGPYILYFGRMSGIKGVHVLSESLPEVLRRHPALRVLMVGTDGPAPNGGTMRDLVRNLVGSEFESRVTFFDPLKPERLYPLVAAASVVALPSIQDNLPNTCLEAMALGCVVVATRGVCFEQLIHDGVSGLLVAAGDVKSLSSGLLNALRLSLEQRASIGKQAQKRIAQMHPDITIPKLLAYFESVIEREGTSVNRRQVNMAFQAS